MRLCALLAASTILASAGPAAARPVKIGAGEHGDHSRVVFNMPAPQSWSAHPLANGVEIRLPGDDYRFNADSVTRRRMAHRVSGFDSRVEGGETVVTLSFDCACAGAVSTHGGKLLTVEVRDSAAERIATDRASAEAAGAIVTNDVPNASTSTLSAPVQGPLVHRADEVERVRDLLLKQLRRAADEGIISFKDEAGGSAPENETEAAHDKPDAGAHEVAAEHDPYATGHGDGESAETHTAPGEPHAKPMAAHIAAAETNAKPAAHAEPMTPAEPITHDAPAETHAKPKPAHDAPAKAHAEPMAAQSEPMTAHDAPAETHSEPAEAQAEPAAPLAACLPDERLDAEQWLDERPFAEALAARRATLYDELNRVDAEAVGDLAAFYLGHLFGHEAAHMIRLFRVEDERLRLLAAVAEVIKDAPPKLSSPFARSEPCPGLHGLWQAAAMWRLDPALSVAAFEATGRELARTPRPFRRLMGGRIARAALAIGRNELAGEIEQLLLRNQDPPSIDMLLVRAELELAEGRTVAAQTDLQSVIEARGAETPLAAIRLSETLSPPLDAVRAEEVGLMLSDLSTQHRDTDDGDALVIAEAQMRARFNDLRGALEAIERAQSRLDAQKPELSAVAQELIAAQVALLESDPRADSAVDAIDALAAAGADAASDALRGRLSRVLIDTGTPHLATLLIDDAAAQRSPELAAVLAEAIEASTLSEPGAAATADPEPAHAPKVDADVAAHAMDEAKAETDALRSTALKRYLADDASLPPAVAEALGETSDHEVRELRRLFEPPLKPHDRETGVEKISRGKQLLENIDSEIDLLKGIADDG